MDADMICCFFPMIAFPFLLFIAWNIYDIISPPGDGGSYGAEF